MVAAMSSLFACGGGGGGGGGDTPPESSEVRIVSPTDSSTYQTDNPSISLSGASFVPTGASCTGIVGSMPGGYQVTWHNSTNGVTGGASFYLGCLLQVNVIWTTSPIPLNLGVNTITVTATDSTGHTGSDTLQVTRLADTMPPTVVSTAPADGATDVWINTSVVVAFSEDMDVLTIGTATFRLEDDQGNPVFASVYYDEQYQRATLYPSAALAYGKTYIATVTTGAKDAAGNGLAADYSFSFQTSANPDTTAPTVESVSPAAGSVCAPTYTKVTATFSEYIDPATLGTGTFSLTGPGGSTVAGAVDYYNRIATFTPATALGVSSTYTAGLATGITDLAGNPLVAPYQWSFTTAADTGAGAWVPTSLSGPPNARHGHVAVWTGSEMIVAGANSQYGRYNPGTETWTVASGGPSVADSRAVWTGTRMLLWGPLLGYVFDPAAGTWANYSTAGQPGVRYDYTAVWTGTELIVWGGRSADYSTEYGDGARYNPSTDTWQPIATAGAPSARYGHSAVWTGSEMIVWGGGASGLTRNDGARYNPSTNTWSAMSNAGAPVLAGHLGVWTGSKMVVWGSLTGNGGLYDPDADSWVAMATACAPTGRLLATATWTGSKMVVWGGWANNVYYGDGYEFDPAANTWTKLTNTAAPSARLGHTAVWTGSRMIVWGGSNGTDLNTGGVLSP